MEKTLYIFNPDHDLATANGTSFFISPNSSLEFRDDAAWLPAFIYPKSLILSQRNLPEDYQQLYKSLGLDTQTILYQDITNNTFSSIEPWGWNFALVFQLQKSGISKELFPSEEYLKNLRIYAHREWATKAAEFILTNSQLFHTKDFLASKIVSWEGAEKFLQKQQNIVLKMPWSGSGKGLRFCKDTYSEHDRGWVLNTIRRQGCVMAEKRANVLQNFAMEFHCNHKITFQGYSLFETHNGTYRESILTSNENIIDRLSRFTSPKTLDAVKELLIQFFEETLLPIQYKGFLGVDMFFYEEDQKILFNPCVEINLRTTMGLLARKISDNFIAPQQSGKLRIRYNKESSLLLSEHLKLLESNPLIIKDRKIKSGYFSLCPLFPNSHYLISLEV